MHNFFFVEKVAQHLVYFCTEKKLLELSNCPMAKNRPIWSPFPALIDVIRYSDPCSMITPKTQT
jgi:hypothetical protein